MLTDLAPRPRRPDRRRGVALCRAVLPPPLALCYLEPQLPSPLPVACVLSSPRRHQPGASPHRRFVSMPQKSLRCGVSGGGATKSFVKDSFVRKSSGCGCLFASFREIKSPPPPVGLPCLTRPGLGAAARSGGNAKRRKVQAHPARTSGARCLAARCRHGDRSAPCQASRDTRQPTRRRAESQFGVIQEIELTRVIRAAKRRESAFGHAAQSEKRRRLRIGGGRVSSRSGGTAAGLAAAVDGGAVVLSLRARPSGVGQQARSWRRWRHSCDDAGMLFVGTVGGALKRVRT
jgi:hypothetical protein